MKLKVERAFILISLSFPLIVLFARFRCKCTFFCQFEGNVFIFIDFSASLTWLRKNEFSNYFNFNSKDIVDYLEGKGLGEIKNKLEVQFSKITSELSLCLKLWYDSRIIPVSSFFFFSLFPKKTVIIRKKSLSFPKRWIVHDQYK